MPRWKHQNLPTWVFSLNASDTGEALYYGASVNPKKYRFSPSHRARFGAEALAKFAEVEQRGADVVLVLLDYCSNRDIADESLFWFSEGRKP